MPNTCMKREVIQHELGHWITARHHGIHTEYIKISRTGNSYHGHCNLFIFPKFYKIEDAKKMMEARIRTLMAGAAAQLIERDSIEWSCVMKIFNTNGANDYDKINEYLNLVSGFSPNTFMDVANNNKIYNNLLKKYWEETTSIIESNIEIIKKLTDYMHCRLESDPSNFTSEELLSKT